MSWIDGFTCSQLSVQYKLELKRLNCKCEDLENFHWTIFVYLYCGNQLNAYIITWYRVTYKSKLNWKIPPFLWEWKLLAWLLLKMTEWALSCDSPKILPFGIISAFWYQNCGILGFVGIQAQYKYLYNLHVACIHIPSTTQSYNWTQYIKIQHILLVN